MNWNPIATAPMDGSRVLLLVRTEFKGKYAKVDFFITDAYCNDDDEWITKWGGDTVESVAYEVSDYTVAPVGWMPIPDESGLI